jgi:hypothetical protein
MNQPFLCLKKLRRRRRCVYKKTVNKKIRSKEGTFWHLKMEIFEFFFFPDNVNTLSFNTITLVCQKTSFNV